MIFGLINKNSGPGFHRIHMPLLLMPDTDVYITNAVKEEDFEAKQPTTVYYNRIISDNILALQSKYHFRIAVDVDDYWELDPGHILYEYHMANRMPEHHIKHIRLADVVTTTHERLAEEIYKINRNVVVVPNAIPTHPYFPRFRIPNVTGRSRIFWQGSVTHGKDIELLHGPFKKLDKNKFQTVIAGYMDGEPEWDKMVSFFTRGLTIPGMVLPGASVDKYYQHYRHADICVCPLRDNKFNAMKSNLKVLEAAHMGLPVIASNVHPYKNIPGIMYVSRQQDWIYWLLKNKTRWKEHAKALWEWCNENHDFDTINETRKQAII
jgi:glycosyltransferase involved in cell wall biosynthesis